MRKVYRSRGPFVRAVRIEREASIGRLDRDLLAALDDGFDEVARRAGSWLPCGPGCGHCCHGPFPITRLDVRRLRRGWRDLRLRASERALAIRRRAREAAATLRGSFPGSGVDAGRPARDERALDRLLRRHRSMPCPVLDPRSGRCELYAARPVACRTYGPPLLFEGEEAASCPLCFRGADRATIRRCRFEPDRDRLETAILTHMGVAPGEEWETLIAFALACG